MSQYLLSTWAVQDEVPGAPMSPEDMKTFMQRIIALEQEMDENGTFVFGGALHGPEAATVVGVNNGEAMTTDGPFAEAKEQIAGFYIIEAEDMGSALAWAEKVAEATNHPIEVRPFRATGKAADHVPEMPGG